MTPTQIQTLTDLVKFHAEFHPETPMEKEALADIIEFVKQLVKG